MSNEQYLTTAAQAEFETSTLELQKEVEANAALEANAAAEAARLAASKGSAFTGETSLGEQLASTTNAAAAEGQADVSGYVGQAKGLANSAINTASAYVPESVKNAANSAIVTATNAIPDSVKTTATSALGTASNAASVAIGTASSALGTASGYAANASAAVQPHVQAAAAAVQPHVNAAAAAVQPHVSAAHAAVKPHIDAATSAAQQLVGQATGTDVITPDTSSKDYSTFNKPTDIPSTTAPLEGQEAVSGTVYPSTTTGAAKFNAL